MWRFFHPSITLLYTHTHTLMYTHTHIGRNSPVQNDIFILMTQSLVYVFLTRSGTKFPGHLLVLPILRCISSCRHCNNEFCSHTADRAADPQQVEQVVRWSRHWHFNPQFLLSTCSNVLQRESEWKDESCSWRPLHCMMCVFANETEIALNKPTTAYKCSPCSK